MSSTPTFPPSGPAGRSRRTLWILGIAGAVVLGILVLIGGCTAALVSASKDADPSTRTEQPAHEDPSPETEAEAEAEADEPADSAPAAAADAEPSEPPASPSTTPGPAEETSSPAPVEAPTFTGSGAEVVILDPLGEDVFYATVTHDGSSNVALWSVDENGQDIDLLVNEIGDYEGTVPINFSGDPSALRMEADGDWAIEFHHLAEAPRWDGTGTYEARGDSVLIVDGAADGLTPVTLTHDGESNFAGWAYGDGSYADLIVNEIGTYEGTTLLPDGSIVLVITADGSWSIAKD